MRRLAVRAAALLVPAALAGTALAADELPSAASKYSYIVGYQVALRVAERMGSQGVDIDVDALKLGLEDALAAQQPRVSQESLMAAVSELQESRSAARSEEAEANLETGRKFLAENAAAEGVTVLDSGLQFVELEPGAGERPDAESTVLVHYRGSLVSGEEFDSSYQRGEPARFTAGQVIPGFREALTRMNEGAKWRVFIPSELGYGEAGAGEVIGPNQVLIFELELIEVVSEEEAGAKESPRGG